MGNQEVTQYLYEIMDWANQIQSLTSERSFEMPNSEQLRTEIQCLLRKVDEIITNPPFTKESVMECHRMATELLTQTHYSFESEDSRKINHNRVPIGKHTLPPLPYDYDALEPYISEEIMRLHHDVHHKSYVDGLNKAEQMMEQARVSKNYDLLKHWEREAAFHGSGHYLHTIFWNIMKPKGGGAPLGEIASQIKKDFDSFKQFKEHFSAAADKVEGVGWAILVWSPQSGRLEILQTEKHQLMTQWDTIPLLVLDVWEHAYYLQYKTDKKRYIENWWHLINWEEVNNRLEQAYKVKGTPY